MERIRKIAVLLTCYNRREKTIACLKSLFRASLPDRIKLEVFLVDDGSTDGTSEAVRDTFPSINIIQGTGSLFWNRGMHLAWETAAANSNFDCYMWLNDDVILYKQALEVILQSSKEKPDSIICGSMCSSNNKTLTYGGIDENHNLLEPSDVIQQCTRFNGNLLLVPDSVYKRIGNLDPKFPHAIGDFDYANRAIKSGFKNYITPGFLGICDEHDSLPIWCLSEVPLKKRIKALYSPLGNSHPYYFFYYERKNYSLGLAIKHFLTIHLRLLFPRLWKLKKN